MKKSWNKKTICLAAAALILTIGVSIGNSMAYFTTYVAAAGGVKVSMGSTETIPVEDVINGQKHIQVQNRGDYDCFVRIKVFTGTEHQDGLKYSDHSGKWTPGLDGYYYYSDILPVGGLTEKLFVSIGFEDKEDAEAFHVIVVQECTPVSYDENGVPYADWSKVAEVTNSSDGKEAL